MAGSHVPKFGQWDNDDLPYTAYFENARKEKAGVRMNPNDPEENPEAFRYMKRGLESNCDCQQVHQVHRKSARSHRNMASESGSEKSNSDRKKGRARGSSSSSSVSGQYTQGNGSSQFVRNRHHRTASVPKFGEWDETDPTSGEGYTAIFNKVKEEKKAPASNFPIVPPHESNYPDCHRSKTPTPSFFSKICCCLF